MSQIINHNEVINIQEQIINAERRLALLKQYVNPQTGTIDVHNALNLCYGINDAVMSIGHSLTKF